jgi:5,10-methylenetetrahydromethanopterin reductase
VQTSMFGDIPLPDGESAIDACVGYLSALREEGFKRVWLLSRPYDPDILTVLAAALREVETIEVATGVLPIQTQHPMLMAQRALTLNLIAGGRFTLGIGVTHALASEGMWGIPWDKPVRRMREYLDGLLPLLSGEGVDVSGDTVTTRGFVRVPGATPPAVYIAAMGPQMLRLAGRRASGTVTWMTGPKTLAEHVVPTLRNAAEEAGRSATAVRVVAGFPVCVTDDPATARRVAAEVFAIYGTLPAYRAMLDREGYSGPEDAAIIGDETVVTQRIDELRAAGVDEFIGQVFDVSDEGGARTFMGQVFDVSDEGRARTRALMRQCDRQTLV